MLARAYGEAGLSRKRWIWIAVLAVVAVAIGVGAWAASGPVTYANIAAGYAAKQTCSCINVSGRTLDSCLADFPADARRNITVSVDGDAVRASVLFGAISSEAVYEEEYGCRVAD
jgi:hypothetical protein